MKGYQMILLVNSGIFFFVAFGSLLYAGVLQHAADHCVPPAPGEHGADCAKIHATAQAGYHWAPYFLAGAILLLGVGVAVGWIRPKPPPEEKEP